MPQFASYNHNPQPRRTLGKKLVLFVSVIHTHVTLLYVSFPILSLSSFPCYLTLRTFYFYFLNLI